MKEVDKILDDSLIRIREDDELLSEYMKKLPEIMEYDISYTSRALMEKL